MQTIASPQVRASLVPASAAEHTSCCYGSTVIELAPARRRRAWCLAVEHLNSHGLPAAVPAELVPALAALGLQVWAS